MELYAEHKQLSTRLVIVPAVLLNILLALCLLVPELSEHEWLMPIESADSHETPIIFTQQGPIALPSLSPKKEDKDPQQKHEPLKPKPVAALKAGKSNFGTPSNYIYDPCAQPDTPDLLEATQQVLKTENKDLQEQSSTLHDNSIHGLHLAEEPKDTQIAFAKKEILPSSQPTTNATSLAAEVINDIPEPVTEKQKDNPQLQTSPKKQSKSVTMPQKDSSPAIINNSTKSPSHQHMIGHKIRSSRSSVQQSQKKRLSLTDLAVGYLYNREGTGHDMINRAGDETIRPDEQDWKYISYLQKIFWHMQATWRQLADSRSIQASFNGIANAEMRIVITKDGSLQDVILLTSSGIPTVDENLLLCIKTASPYPPLPNHFQHDTFTYQGWLGVEGHEAPNRNLFQLGLYR